MLVHHSRALTTVATGAYAANCALGASVAAGWVDTSNVRWVHHGLYVMTSVTTAAAVLSLLGRRSPAAVVLAPAALPLFMLQHHGARPLSRHTRDALRAAPCYAAALVVAWR